MALSARGGFECRGRMSLILTETDGRHVRATFLLSRSNKYPPEEGIFPFLTDKARDHYKAGLCEVLRRFFGTIKLPARLFCVY